MTHIVLRELVHVFLSCQLKFKTKDEGTSTTLIQCNQCSQASYAKMTPDADQCSHASYAKKNGRNANQCSQASYAKNELLRWPR